MAAAQRYSRWRRINDDAVGVAPEHEPDSPGQEFPINRRNYGADLAAPARTINIVTNPAAMTFTGSLFCLFFRNDAL